MQNLSQAPRAQAGEFLHIYLFIFILVHLVIHPLGVMHGRQGDTSFSKTWPLPMSRQYNIMKRTDLGVRGPQSGPKFVGLSEFLLFHNFVIYIMELIYKLTNYPSWLRWRDFL